MSERCCNPQMVAIQLHGIFKQPFAITFAHSVYLESSLNRPCMFLENGIKLMQVRREHAISTQKGRSLDLNPQSLVSEVICKPHLPHAVFPK